MTRSFPVSSKPRSDKISPWGLNTTMYPPHSSAETPDSTLPSEFATLSTPPSGPANAATTATPSSFTISRRRVLTVGATLRRLVRANAVIPIPSDTNTRKPSMSSIMPTPSSGPLNTPTGHRMYDRQGLWKNGPRISARAARLENADSSPQQHTPHAGCLRGQSAQIASIVICFGNASISLASLAVNDFCLILAAMDTIQALSII